MKLTQLMIQNFRSCRRLSLTINSLHALVGLNGSGKSSVLQALDFLFNPSKKTLNEDMFWNNDLSLEIRVEAVFRDLSDSEKRELRPYLLEDESFRMARSARIGSIGKEPYEVPDQSDDGKSINQEYYKMVPSIPWLDESEIKESNISEWWKKKNELQVGNYRLFEKESAQVNPPTVKEWKEIASRFLSAHKEESGTKERWVANPKGYANVLKGTLPFFILIPAVRDVTEEAKVSKSNPFGRLLYAILDNITGEEKEKIEETFADVTKKVNRAGGKERLVLIERTEKQLNGLLCDIFPGCDLEIEFQTPTLEEMINTPKLYVDDGFRNTVENKGHGLQRAIIFTILRQYAEQVTSSVEGKKRSLIIGVEEPELYMHPHAQRMIRQVFSKIAKSGDQIIFSTHSSLLVDVAHFDEIIRMESEVRSIEGKKTTISYAWQLKIDSVITDTVRRYPKLKGTITEESIRELYAHAYNPHRNEGFFASKIILVEGLTEEYSLPIYADSIPGCELDTLGISVVECGGKGQMDRLYRIFNELHIPCYLIFDYDKGSTDSNSIDKSRELLELIGESPDKPNELIVGDSVSCFPTKWEEWLNQEIPNVENMTRDARELLGLSVDSSKPLVARYIARKITSSKPPVIPPSLEKIIKKAVSVKWIKTSLVTH